MAGNGTLGVTDYQLRNPWGIYVDLNYGLYVADYGNHRVQYFEQGRFMKIANDFRIKLYFLLIRFNKRYTHCRTTRSSWIICRSVTLSNIDYI